MAFSVTEVVTKIKSLIEGDLRGITLEGEISNLSPSSAGHYYFTLSDSTASLGSVMFKMDSFRYPIIRNLKNGDKVLVSGDIGVYVKGGRVQLIVKVIKQKGKGDLLEQFEKLKRKLSNEGLFNVENKQALPYLPKKIAVITALGGAALHDFINIFKRRSIWMDLVIIPATVQGATAPKLLVSALKRAQKVDPDVIVITRGGGSFEDLFCFNDEVLAYEIFKCKIPTISAVGHQVDFSITDFVADKRCETPSAAAEFLTNNQEKIRDSLNQYRKLLIHTASFVQEKRRSLSENNPKIILDKIYTNFISFRKCLEAFNLLNRSHELIGIHEKYQQIDEAIFKISDYIKRRFEVDKNRVLLIENMLNALDPKGVLERGYSFIKLPTGEVVESKKDYDALAIDSLFEIHFSDGHGIARK